MRKALFPPWALLCALILLGSACQGVNDRFGGPQPRSGPPPGELQELPPETDLAASRSISGAGGQLTFRGATLTVPVGAIIDPTFIELSMPLTPPVDVQP